MAKTLRQRISDLKAENQELQEIVADYEERFETIQGQLPEEEDQDEGDDQDDQD